MITRPKEGLDVQRFSCPRAATKISASEDWRPITALRADLEDGNILKDLRVVELEPP
jgi:hypothetical protein